MKVLIVYYSSYGHFHTMTEAIAEGRQALQQGNRVGSWFARTLYVSRCIACSDG